MSTNELEKLNNILQQVPEENFRKMIEYVKDRYGKEECYGNIDQEFLIDFFGTNYSTGIWYESLKNSMNESDYNEIMKLESQDWEMADILGASIGRYIIKNFIQIGGR